jgi:hypothetical protein
MARKPIAAHPTRDRSRDDESLLLRSEESFGRMSAESLGRMIGSLQKELDIASGWLASGKPNGSSRKRGARKKSPRKSAKKR